MFWGSPRSHSGCSGLLPPVPGKEAASQSAWGSPASQRAWIGLLPLLPGAGAGRVSKASHTACGTPASHTAWIGPVPVGTPEAAVSQSCQV